jgi:hypothetical protein
LAITRESDRLFARLTGQQPAPIFPSSQRSFSLKAADAELTFNDPTDSSESGGVTLHQGEVEHYAKRIDSAHLTPERMRVYTGTFYSDELDTLYTVSSRDGKLFVRYPRGESELKPTTTDMFEAEMPFMFKAEMPFRTVTYRCSAERRCDACAGYASTESISNP